MPSFKQTQLDFAAHLRNPDTQASPKGLEERRLNIYRNLFFNSISSLVAGTFPVLHTILNSDEWDQLIRNFYQTKHNKTPHFPEIPREFVDFLKQQPVDAQKPFIYELALYEWLELHLDKHLSEPAFQTGTSKEQLLNQIPVINEASSLNAYQYPVHQISKNNQPETTLEQPVFLLLWRNRFQKVKFTELNPFSALLWEQLKNNSTYSGKQILIALAEQNSVQDVDQFIAFGTETLLQWQEQNIINTTRKSA